MARDRYDDDYDDEDSRDRGRGRGRRDDDFDDDDRDGDYDRPSGPPPNYLGFSIFVLLSVARSAVSSP